MDKILLIDGHNQIYRACVKFGNPKQKTIETWTDTWTDEKSKENYQEQPDEVIFTFNFFRNLRPLIEQFAPDKCFFILEGHPQFRYDLFADYKANRIHKQASAKQNNLSESFHKAKDLILDLIKHLPITICRAQNYEADDVIFTLCENMRDEDITILSNDSDFIQILQKGYKSAKVYSPIKKTFMEAPEYPYVAWKCLNGDKSDNIPKLLSPKKAINTVSDPKLFEAFLSTEENRANFSINKQLIEFRFVPLEEISIVEGSKNFDLLKKEFAQMEFESIINDKSWERYKSSFNSIKF